MGTQTHGLRWNGQYRYERPPGNETGESHTTMMARKGGLRKIRTPSKRQRKREYRQTHGLDMNHCPPQTWR